MTAQSKPSEPHMADSKFSASQAWLERARRTIPTGSQTFSKSHDQFPKGHAPLFVAEGKGAKFTDLDGNEFVDLIMGLSAVGLGYRDPDVDAAVMAQLAKGMTFSLPTRLEAELAELIVECVPSAEMVRFGKNGSDATSAAIRLARAFTGRDMVLACSYHGWHDWYIGATSRNLGVPDDVSALTKLYSPNDLDGLAKCFEENPDQIACVIVEPMLLDTPRETLSAIRNLAHEHGALLVLDEVLTGFRFALGGAQQLYGVTPDLTSFGKSMANGMPLSAIAGRADIMSLMDQIFFSGTFGGEAVSLAASIAAISKIRDHGVIEHFWDYGTKTRSAIEDAIDSYQLNSLLGVINEPCFGLISVSGTDDIEQPVLRTFMLEQMIEHGVFMNGSIAVCYAYGDEELERVSVAFESFAQRLRYFLDLGDATLGMDYEAIRPVFSVRKARDGGSSD
jgi:glutamate-1-semialdehyde 2,1-aminomutase